MKWIQKSPGAVERERKSESELAQFFLSPLQLSLACLHSRSLGVVFVVVVVVDDGSGGSGGVVMQSHKKPVICDLSQLFSSLYEKRSFHATT